jgi:hypothetical protein
MRETPDLVNAKMENIYIFIAFIFVTQNKIFLTLIQA